MAAASPVYSALRTTVPAVLKNITPDDIAALKATSSNLMTHTQQVRGTASNRVDSAQSSVFTSSYTHLSPVGTWIVAFGTLLINTINSWDESSAGTNAGQVVGLTAMVATAIHAGVVYWRNSKQTALVQERTEQFVHLQTIFNSLDFLNQSRKMAKQCLKVDPPANLPLIFPVFETYMTGLPAGVVPNNLSAEWTEIGRIIRLPAEHADHAQMPILVSGRVLPMISHYIDELNQQLTDLGFRPPQPPPAGDAQNAGPPVQVVLDAGGEA